MPLRVLARALPAALLGAGAALALVSCGSSGQGLIPSANAGPLQADFEAVLQEAESGDGRCAGTEAALLRTERDYAALPPSVDGGLRHRLSEGISKLREEALSLCAQPHPGTTVTTTTPKTTVPTKTTTTPTVTQTTPAQTTPTNTTPGPAPEGGGTPAPGGGGGEEAAPGNGQGNGGSPPGRGQDNGEGAGPDAGPGAGPPGGGR